MRRGPRSRCETSGCASQTSAAGSASSFSPEIGETERRCASAPASRFETTSARGGSSAGHRSASGTATLRTRSGSRAPEASRSIQASALIARSLRRGSAIPLAARLLRAGSRRDFLTALREDFPLRARESVQAFARDFLEDRIDLQGHELLGAHSIEAGGALAAIEDETLDGERVSEAELLDIKPGENAGG